MKVIIENEEYELIQVNHHLVALELNPTLVCKGGWLDMGEFSRPVELGILPGSTDVVCVK